MQTVVLQDERHTGTLSTTSRLSSLVQHYPLASFFVLAYLISWALWLPLVVAGDGSPTGLAFVPLLLGSLVPSAVAIVLVAVLHGKGGVRTVLRRLLIWRVGLGWWAAIVLLSMLALAAVGVSVLLGGDAPDVTGTVPGAIFLFLFSIFPGSAGGEELGWRGFALPHLQRGRSALGASVVPRVGCMASAAVPDRSGFPPAQPLRPVGSRRRGRFGHLHVDLQRHRREPVDRRPVSRGIQRALDGLLGGPLRRPGRSALPDLRRTGGRGGRARGGCCGTGGPLPHARQAGWRARDSVTALAASQMVRRGRLPARAASALRGEYGLVLLRRRRPPLRRRHLPPAGARDLGGRPPRQRPHSHCDPGSRRGDLPAPARRRPGGHGDDARRDRDHRWRPRRVLPSRRHRVGRSLHGPARARRERDPARDRRPGHALEGSPHGRQPATRYLRRSLTVATASLLALGIVWFLVFPAGFAYIYTHTGKEAVTPDLEVPYESVSVKTSDSLELAASYVPSQNRAAVVLFPGATVPSRRGC